MKQPKSIYLVHGPAIILALSSAVGCGDSSGNGGGGGGTGDSYVFATDSYDAYHQVDRHGAVEAGTVGIDATSGLGFPPLSMPTDRDDYNHSNPEEDAAGMWLPIIGQSVTDLHAALDADLISLGFTPASVNEAVAQAGPVLVPDAIKYNPDLPTLYPNGRALEDPVIDITLAAALLQFNGTQDKMTFADIPLNPPANDKPFKADFPYLAPPN